MSCAICERFGDGVVPKVLVRSTLAATLSEASRARARHLHVLVGSRHRTPFAATPIVQVRSKM